LGGGDKMVAVRPFTKQNKWVTKIEPEIKNLPMIKGWAPNNEDILNWNPDLVFVFPEHLKITKKIDIPSIVAEASTMKETKEAISIICKSLGLEDQADEILSYWEEKEEMLQSETSDIEDKKRVYLTTSADGLTTGTKGSSFDEMIKKAGGVNVAENATGSSEGFRSVKISSEQLLTWDPEVILIDQGTGQTPENFMSNPIWDGLEAVEKEQVYMVPKGVFWWSRPGAEHILGSQWLAKELYPNEFSDLNMEEITKDFYSDFYGYDLSEEEVSSLLNPSP
jgi:iron complex transport system substrate-binding protein